jgi:uncharacterized protein (DUF1800 family)
MKSRGILHAGMGLFLSVCLLAPGGGALCADTALTEHQKTIHVLNRLGFGPRPGDVERIEKLGLDRYIEGQLHPGGIDDSAVEKKVAVLETLSLSAAELMKAQYADTRAFIERQKEMGGNDEARKEMRTRYGFEVARDEGKVGNKAAAPETAAGAAGMNQIYERLKGSVSLRAVGELQAAKLVRAVESERQLQEVLVDFWANHFNIDVKKGYCRVLKVVDEREVIRPHIFGRFRDLLGASARSPAMLNYLDNNQNSTTREISYAEQRMRAEYQKKLFGGVLQEASADGKPVKDGGLNENYGREILELHTLGVDGGYTQKDVVEVSRCFTGWGNNPLTGDFQFGLRRHDQGEKIVLGNTIPANGGMQDGEKVLDIISRHPSTAKFIATKLCRRFISDDPPAAAVERVARVFLDTNGDLRQVVAAVIRSPEFFAPDAYSAKIKSPFEYAVSAVRALGARMEMGNDAAGTRQITHAFEGAATIGYGADSASARKRKTLNWHIYDMGQSLYAFQAPTGWPEDSRKWVSSGALISRLNFALALSDRSVSDLAPASEPLLRGVDLDKADEVLDHLASRLVQGELSAGTRATLKRQLASGEEAASSTVNAPKLLALVLGSPEFQRR